MTNDRCTRRVFGRRFARAAVGTAIAPFAVFQTKPKQLPRVGFLIGSSFPTMVEAFRSELRQLGHVEGQSLVLEMRLSRPNTNDLASQVQELAAMDLDVVVAAALPVALAFRKLNTSTPMVIGTGPALVRNGLAESMDRPGKKTTGLDELPPGLTARRLRLLKEAAPQITRVALLSTTPGVGGHEIQVADAESIAPDLGVSVRTYRVASLSELEFALAAIPTDGMNGLVNFQGALSLVNRDRITAFAAKHRIPAIYQSRHFVDSGGLMALAPDQDEQFRAAARAVDKILKGADAGTLPIRYPERYFLTINQQAAKAIGLDIPPGLLARADAIVR